MSNDKKIHLSKKTYIVLADYGKRKAREIGVDKLSMNKTVSILLNEKDHSTYNLGEEK